MKHYFLLAILLVFCGCSSTGANSSPAAETDAEDAATVGFAESLSTAPVAPDETRSILVVVGDSLSAGYGLDPGESYPDEMQRQMLARDLPWRVVNLGISGDTTAGGASRIDSALSLNPDVVLIELGGNDGLRGLPLTATRANMEKMIAAFKDAGATVVLAGMTLPPNWGPDYISDFEAIYRELADEHGLDLIPFLLADMVTEDLRYFQRDGIHPTAEGAVIVAGTVIEALEETLVAPAAR